MELWMWILLAISGVVLAAGFIFQSSPDAQEKMQKAIGQKKKKGQHTDITPEMLSELQETAENFLEFDETYKGMITFTKDPNYFTMAFGVNGVNISMYSVQERMALKSGFMSILNTLKDDTQFLVQSRYVDLSKNFEVYKPVIASVEKEIDYQKEKAKIEQNDITRRKLLTKVDKLAQRNSYANHIIDFFNFYTKESDCIYIKLFVIVNYRHVSKGRRENRQAILDEAYNALANKVKIFREQFESMRLKTYELDNVQAVNIIYSTLLKNESSYETLENAIKSGLLDMIVENPPGEAEFGDKEIKYEDDYDYDYEGEAAASGETD